MSTVLVYLLLGITLSDFHDWLSLQQITERKNVCGGFSTIANSVIIENPIF
jgi:hypothetical protein